MIKGKNYGIFILLILNFLNINCTEQAKEKTFGNESDLIAFLQYLKIDTKRNDIVLIPATSCRSCLIGDLTFLDSIPNAIVLIADNEKCPTLKTQKCIQYSSEIAADYGLIKYYLQYFKIEDNHVKQYKTINK
jgi:hypothetical protein